MGIKNDDMKTMLAESAKQVTRLTELNQELVRFITKHQEYLEEKQAVEDVARLLLVSNEAASYQLSIAEFIGKHFKDQS